MRYELSDYEWTAIKPMLPNKPRGVRRVNDRRVLNGIFWVLRSGAPWRDLPETYGPRTTCYNRFVRWRRAGVWDRIMEAMASGHDAAVQMIDTSVVRVHQHGACIADNNHQDMGRSRGGLTSKLHAVVDANGLPVHLALTPGEAHDNRLCSVLLSALLPQTILLADRGYDADWIRELARQQGAWANIPPKRNRKDPICFSPYLYRARNLIERFFNKIKQCRRIATRYDNDDDLGFLVGVGKTVGEGLESGIVSACAEGCHVEDITDRHPTAVDTSVPPECRMVRDRRGRRSACGSSSRVLAAGR
jgi:transposase